MRDAQEHSKTSPLNARVNTRVFKQFKKICEKKDVYINDAIEKLLKVYVRQHESGKKNHRRPSILKGIPALPPVSPTSLEVLTQDIIRDDVRATKAAKESDGSKPFTLPSAEELRALRGV